MTMTPSADGPVGRSVPNRRWARLVRGRGRYVANLPAQRCLHAAMVRSTEAHGVLEAVHTEEAARLPGVVAIFTAADMERVCRPWRAEHALFSEAKVPDETPLARDRVRYVGEPVAVVVAEDADAARDAADLVTLEVSPLPPLTDPAAALDEDAPALHPELANGGEANLHFALSRPAEAARGTAVDLSLTFSRTASQAMETRGLLAHWDAADGTLTVHQSHQHPHMMQDVYARHLGIPEHRVRVVCEDVGGAFGGKQQLHPDEMATVAASVLLGRPVRFVASRSESLLVDCQARDHKVALSAVLDPATGRVASIRCDDLCGIGAFGHFPRTSFGESMQMTRLVGAAWAIPAVAMRTRLAFQNRPHLGHFRGVGHPVACLATEGLMDKAARAAGEDPIAFRRRHLLDLSAGPVTTPGGVVIDRYRMAECLDALEAGLAGAPRGRRDGRLHGVGVACLIELTSNGSRYYGDGGINITTDETAVIRMEPSGVVRLATANTEQGQGADEALAQIVADVLDLQPEDVMVVSGDSQNCPYGGGAFASRGTATGGKAARDAALRLRERLLATAGILLQRQAGELALRGGQVVGPDGAALMNLGELARTCQFKPHLLPEGHDAGLTVVGRHTPQPDAMASSAAFGACVAVDAATGRIEVTRLLAVHDGGTIVNPASVDGQVQGGAAQGLGQALLEAIRVDEAGQPLTGSFMDYAMPRADDVPPVEMVHLPPLPQDAFAPRGVGELGASAAPAAIINALNDALAVEGAEVTELPATPEVVWRALNRARGA